MTSVAGRLRPIGQPKCTANAVRTGLVAILLACCVPGCVADDTVPPTRWLRALRGPATLVVGSPVELQGRGLAGALLELRTASGVGQIRVRPAIVGGLAAQSAEAEPADLSAELVWRVAEVVQAPTAAAVREACLVADETVADVGTCVTLPSPPAIGSLRFDPLPGLGVPTLHQAVGVGQGIVVPVGASLALSATGLPLPGEGEAWLELDDRGGPIALAAGATVAVQGVPWSRDGGQIAVDAAGLGVTPGKRRLRMRVARLLQTSSAVELGAWSADMDVTVVAPTLVWPRPGQSPLVVRRGRASALGWPGPGCPTDAALEIDGTWTLPDGTTLAWLADAPRTLRFVHLADGSCRAALPADVYVSEGWAAIGVGAILVGQAAIRVGTWRSAPSAIALQIAASAQVVELRFEPGVALGLHRFGLAQAAGTIEARVRALVQAHVAGLNLSWVESPASDVVDLVRIRVLGDDPNGLGLLGTEPSRGKDEGNRRWDERIGGFCADAWLAGVPAWGGIFISSFLRFSPTLTLTASADPRFDAIFGPFAPELGGTPVQDAAGLAAAGGWIEALSQLLAGTISHELGHALGLAAGTTEFHHPTDHPGWRMDAGTARPFAERAALPGEQAEEWGPVDLAYLQAILAP